MNTTSRMRHPMLGFLGAVLLLALTCAVHATSTSTVTYVYTDPQGTPLAEADVNGNITATYDYAPYGTIAPNMSPAPNGPGYTGHVNDPESGLVYMQARYYDPSVGRFLSVDPVAPDAGNTDNFSRYVYVGNNPVNNIDPSGKSTCANNDCSKSTINSVLPRANPQPPPVNGMQGISPSSPMGGKVSSGYATNVTFKNDDPKGASPNQPITTATANMVESAVTKSGVQSVNINSTTGGVHTIHSNHYLGKAIDINRVNGARVSERSNASAVSNLQNAFKGQPNIQENFGPAFQEKTYTPGGAAVSVPSVAEDHENHIHEAGQQ